MPAAVSRDEEDVSLEVRRKRLKPLPRSSFFGGQGGRTGVATVLLEEALGVFRDSGVPRLTFV